MSEAGYQGEAELLPLSLPIPGLCSCPHTWGGLKRGKWGSEGRYKKTRKQVSVTFQTRRVHGQLSGAHPP